MSLYLTRMRSSLNLALASVVLMAGSASLVAGEPRHHVLDFSAEGTAFLVKEPSGWFADTTIAREFGADVIFYPAASDPRSYGTPVIRVLVMKKTSDDTEALLNRYVNLQRARYRNADARDSTATHSRFRAVAKRFCAPGKFCEYVTYLNPGPGSNLMLSVTLKRPKHPATSTELAAYKGVVASFDVDQAR